MFLRDVFYSCHQGHCSDSEGQDLFWHITNILDAPFSFTSSPPNKKRNAPHKSSAASWALQMTLKTMSSLSFLWKQQCAVKSMAGWSGQACTPPGQGLWVKGGSWHFSLPTIASLLFHQRILKSWREVIGNSRDVEAQPRLAHHKHKISLIFSSVNGNLMFNISFSFFPKMLVPFYLFPNIKKKSKQKLQVQYNRKNFYPDVFESKLLTPELYYPLQTRTSSYMATTQPSNPEKENADALLSSNPQTPVSSHQLFQECPL